MIKICGLSTPETISAAAQAGASHVGFVHFEKSPRHISLDNAARLRAVVPDGVKTVLLLVNADMSMISNTIERFKPDIIQFHGKESPEWISQIREQTGLECWRAVAVQSLESLQDAARFKGAVDRLLFDAPPPSQAGLPGGNGTRFDWSLLAGHDHQTPWGLAGGLTPDNVAQAIRATGTPLVDTSSGVESAPGVKDVDRIAAFCKAARET